MKTIASRIGFTIMFAFAAFVGIFPCDAHSFTIDEAVKRALEVSFIIKEQKEVVKKSEFSYISTIDPYLPRADIESSYIRSLSGRRSVSYLSGSDSVGARGSRDAYTFDTVISYLLFDGGERYAQRKGAFFLSEREKEKLKGVRVDVIYLVKTAFFVVLGNKGIVDKKQEALSSAEKILALTKGRYDAGVAKKSDVLQSEVRRTTARIEYLDALREYEKTLAELKSLLLYDPEDKQDVEGPLEEPRYDGDYRKLTERAISVRPDVTAQTQEVERLNMAYKERMSAWFPRINAQLQQTRQDDRFFPEGKQESFIINFSFPLFDGVGRYYNLKGASSDIAAAKHRLEEIKRNVRVEIIKAFKDYEKSVQNVTLYGELVREATSNFDQAFGEYRVGKGDILALLQSERDLAKAKENLIGTISAANTSFANLERVAYINGE
ncbi:MAG: outer membrane channel protein [Syntrophorhabdus sp. PtaU1.Bin002]|nr:MAG: outer membrane channel protein [Syntrophorhabdus sp. PtaU1.Bin002]